MKHGLFMAGAFVILVMAGCTQPVTGHSNVQGDSSGSTYTEMCWGEWIRMDADETWYISGGAIKINGSVSSTPVSLAKQSDRVIEVTEGGRKYYLYASRIANARFTGKVAGFDGVSLSTAGGASPSIQQSAAGGKGWINVLVKNLDNGSTKETQTDDAGKFTVDGAIPGDTYEITPEGGMPVTVTPQGDGDDVGTITVTDGVNFKTRITEDNGAPYLYANGAQYDFTIKTTNIGTEDCLAATYQLGFDGGLVTAASTEKKIWGTIEPGASKTISLSLKCGAIEAEYAYKKITITITDVNQKIWVDSITVKFYKMPTYFYLQTDPSAAAPVYGVVINPYDNKASRFQADGENLSYVTMPWSSSGYLVVFSGATAATEAVYALGVNRPPAYSASDFENFNEPGRYEPNNTEQTASVVIYDSMMAYLHKNDIDCYRYMVPCPEKEPEFEDSLFQVPSSLSLDESLEWIGAYAIKGGAYTVILNGDELVAPKTLYYGGKTVSITLVGGFAERTVSLGSNGALFTVRSGVTLKLGNNITLRGRSSNTSSLVRVESGGALEMKFGSKISGNTSSSLSGGVDVSGMFTMSGGEISGNTSPYGGGVCVSSFISSGIFTMSGGKISGNTSSSGSGVYVLSGTFTMGGGEISGNTASSGGGVDVSGTFTMNGGEISGNTASFSGGGVYVSGGTFTKHSGGVIYGAAANSTLKNTAISGYGYGHAVYVYEVYVLKSQKRRDFTVGTWESLDSTKSGAAGAWAESMPGNLLSLDESLAWLSANAAEGGEYTFTLRANESLAPRRLYYSGKKVSITLLGGTEERTVSLSSNGSLFTVKDGVTLTLGNNITLRGRSDNTSALVRVDSSGKLEMNSGSKISGNANTSYNGFGGGVYVHGGAFIKQSGGIIYGSNESSSLKNTASTNNGHAVYVNSSPAKKRNNTAGEGVTLDSKKDGSEGGWE